MKGAEAAEENPIRLKAAAHAIAAGEDEGGRRALSLRDSDEKSELESDSELDSDDDKRARLWNGSSSSSISMTSSSAGRLSAGRLMDGTRVQTREDCSGRIAKQRRGGPRGAAGDAADAIASVEGGGGATGDGVISESPPGAVGSDGSSGTATVKAAGSGSAVRANSVGESARVDRSDRGHRITCTSASHSQRQVSAHAADVAIEP